MLLLRKLLIITSIGLILAGCGQQGSDELVIYSGRSDKFVKPVIAAFTEKTGIKVLLHAGKPTPLLHRLESEGAQTPADLFISNDAGSLQKGSMAGLFARIDADLANRVPANFRAADNTWLGLSARARVLVGNTQRKAEWGFVNSVMNLEDRRLQGKIAITTSSKESFIAGATVYAESLSYPRITHWARGLKTNAAGEAYAKHGRIVSDVAAGNKAIGLVNHYYVFRHLAKYPDAPIELIVPDQGEGKMGVAWNVAGVAVSKHSQKTAAINAFLDFVTAVDGQQLFAELNQEYPVRDDVPLAPGVPARASLTIANVPMAALGEQRAATVDALKAAALP